MLDTPDEVSVNPLKVFFLILTLPYALFLGVLMLLTGETNPFTIFNAVVTESNSVYFKSWVIGTFALAMVGTMFVSMRKTGKIINDKLIEKKEEKRVGGGSVAPASSQVHFVIEEDDLSSAALEKPGKHDSAASS